MLYYNLDFSSVLDDTLKEKYEFLYLELHKIHETISVNFIITSPEVAGLFTISSSHPITEEFKDLTYAGKYGLFKIYTTSNIPQDEIILFGVKENAVLEITNFIEEYDSVNHLPKIISSGKITINCIG